MRTTITSAFIKLTTGLVILSGWVDSGGGAFAQVTPDGTLSTTVTQAGNNFTIDNGNRAGSNLFHSFGQFSVPTGGAAIFNNAIDVQNIFSRVTGGSVSNIDGAIRANGTANLFLLNPSGILFGPNASLNIGGSFVGTTANSIKFADGAEFSAANATGTPLLTMSVPIGLQMGQNPGTIVVRTRSARGGLQVPTQQTLALIGGDVQLEGGRLIAPQGRIELGSVAANNSVQLRALNPGWTFNYQGVNAFKDISLSQAALATDSGASGGAIHLQARQLSVKAGSILSANTLGSAPGGGISMSTTESITVQGTDANGRFSQITTEVMPGATGRGGDITLQTPQLSVLQGGLIGTATWGGGNAGNLKIDAADILVSGFTPNFTLSRLLSYVMPTGTGNAGDIQVRAQNIVVESAFIQNGTGGKGNGGNLTIETQRLQVLGGAQLQAYVFGGSGNAGNFSLKATDSVEIRGMTPFTIGSNGFARLDGVGGRAPSALLTSVEQKGQGNGGDMLIETGRLAVSEGGTISSSTGGSGNAGNINIRATNVLVRDQITNFAGGGGGIGATTQGTGAGGTIKIAANQVSILNGGILATSSGGSGKAGNLVINADLLDLAGSSTNNSPSQIVATSKGSGDAGSIQLTLNRFQVRDQAVASVSSKGSGSAGNLTVQAQQVSLDRSGSLRAESQAGTQGNINITAESLVLRRNSLLTTTASNTASGGNITINAPVIVGWENSDIVANALQGQGGNIQITTQGILGLKYRDRLTPENDITASSEFGVNGTVQINTIGVDPNAGLVNLPVNLTDPSQQIAQGCAANQGSSFVVTGRGGMPLNPMAQTRSSRPWADTRNLTAVHSPSTTTVSTAPSPPAPLIPATGWRRTAKGKVELYADSTALTSPTMAGVTCTP